MKRLVHIGIASLLLTACGSDGPNFGPETTPTAAQQSGIASTEQSLILLSSADTQGEATAGAAIGLATASQLLIAPKSSARLAPGNATAWTIGDVLSVLPQQPPADCAVVSASSVVWTNCTEEGFTINGMISWSPGHVEVDVHINGSGQGVTFQYALEGSITVTASSIKGDMTMSGSATTSGASFSETVHSAIDVQIAQGCVTSGTLTVTVNGSGTGAVNGAVQVIWSGCRAFTVRNA